MAKVHFALALAGLCCCTSGPEPDLESAFSAQGGARE